MKSCDIRVNAGGARKGKRHLGPLKDTNAMANKRAQPHKRQPPELTPDHLGENRREFVAKLAYQYWEDRGRPFGSPEVDWYQAERAVYSSLLRSGLLSLTPNDPENMAEQIYK
jgi:hypothetical protein